jgi:uncharacterized RDD family membrane protein YckC
MKCPKCGYLGFETTDRCRNCGYDFSLATVGASPDLSLRTAEGGGPVADLTLREARDTAPSRPPHAGDLPIVLAPGPGLAPGLAPEDTWGESQDAEPDRSDRPGDELPLFPPRPAGQPLAVRRPSEVPRAKRSTPRLTRGYAPALPLVPEPRDAMRGASREGVASDRPREAGTLPARMAAALLDLLLLAAIDAGIVWLTLRIAGLEATRADLALIRPWPMTAFLMLLAFLYVVGFTVGGGQTIGKMAFGLRVVGDDGAGVDLTAAIVRSTGCLVAVLTGGLLFAPALVSADRRAPYDRIARTRVVRA